MGLQMHAMSSPLFLASPSPGRREARGVAMLVVLIFTLALTAIGIVSAKLAVQGEAMARNQLDSQVARQAAEAALRDAERDLMLATGVKRSNAPCARDAERPVRDKESLFDSACTHGQCAYNDSVRTTANFANASATAPGEAWWPTSKGGLWNNSTANKPSRLDSANDANCAAFTGAVPLGVYTGGEPIRGVVQQPEYLIESVRRGGAFFFRITARGFGYRQGTEVVVQSYFRVPDL